MTRTDLKRIWRKSVRDYFAPLRWLRRLIGTAARPGHSGRKD